MRGLILFIRERSVLIPAYRHALLIRVIRGHARSYICTNLLLMKTFLSFCFVLIALTSFAQKDSAFAPPYQRFPVLPPLQVLLADSTTKYTKADLPKNKPVLIMLFSPDCEHCQHEAEMFYAGRDLLDKIQIVMITTYPIFRMTDFASKYGLDSMKNVVVAKDPHYFLIPFYDVHNFPFMALYDKKGKFIQTIESSATVEKILAAFGK